MLVSGAEYIIDFLREKGVRTVFGYPGSPVLDIYEQFYRCRDDIAAPRHILMRHEQGACHAACGYARATGRPGVCIATSGPGATNLVTAIADAYLDSVPLLVITGQVGVMSIGRDAFQEADIMGITIPVTKHNYLVKRADALRSTLEEAWRIASSGRPGPVLVDISRDVFAAQLDDSVPCGSALPRVRENPLTLGSCIDDIRSALERCYRPVILAGGGTVSAGAGGLLSRFAEKYDIPVATTLMGMGIKLNSGARMLGLTGMYGTPAANAAMEQADLVLAAGCRFSDRTVSDFERFSHTKMLIHADIDSAEISKNVTADIAAVCSAHELFSCLLDGEMKLRREDISLWNAQLDGIFRREKTPPPTPSDRLSCREILRQVDICEHELRDAIYVTDVGNHQMTAARELEPIFERGFITSGGLGVMGFGLPAAIGASLSLSAADAAGIDTISEYSPLRARQIVLICGDGGFQMTMQELAPLARLRSALPVKVFLMDNNALGMIRTMQRARYEGHLMASELENPDFGAIAGAYGIKSVRLDINSRPTLAADIRAVLESRENIIVHCVKTSPASGTVL
ncbi:MAG: thiamine pyrophosphate-binding protein [Eubacteriales bacterium]